MGIHANPNQTPGVSPALTRAGLNAKAAPARPPLFLSTLRIIVGVIYAHFLHRVLRRDDTGRRPAPRRRAAIPDPESLRQAPHGDIK